MTAIVETPETARLLDELTTPIGRDDPYPRYDRLREISRLIRAEDGALVVTGYDECQTVVRDSRLGHFPTDMLGLAGLADWADHPGTYMLFTSLVTLNPPDHTRLRRLVSSAFTARRVAALRPSIERMVDDLLADLAGAGDFIDRFAFPLPVNVIGELLGIPAADRAQFQSLIRDWSQVLETVEPSALEKADPAAATLRDYLTGLVAERRKDPRDDLISALVAVEADGDRLTEDELLTMVAFLFAAGFETTTNLLANGLVALLANPGATIADPGLAAEELLRWDSPVQLVSRVVYEPVEMAGLTIEPGERVVAYLGAGNRDAARFDHPNTLDLRRTDNSPLSFGGGIHYCVGAPLARLEAQIAFPALRSAYPNLALTAEPTRRNSLTLRGYTEMPVATN
ncbi:cytochrome P450 [Actinoplanes sp. NPDC089786]|uniref:cytochrome P450 n=1 Tax=Actinoplanes sp. NPDC089786 TaxID=3155185 RepID=UPI00342B121F